MTTKVVLSNTGHLPLQVRRGEHVAEVLDVGAAKEMTLWAGDDGVISIRELPPIPKPDIAAT